MRRIKRAEMTQAFEVFAERYAALRGEFTEREFHTFLAAWIGRELTRGEKISATQWLSSQFPRRRERGKGPNKSCVVVYMLR